MRDRRAIGRTCFELFCGAIAPGQMVGSEADLTAFITERPGAVNGSTSHSSSLNPSSNHWLESGAQSCSPSGRRPELLNTDGFTFAAV